jgi:hypothetical protein
VNDPEMPDLNRVIDPSNLAVGERSATQRTRLIVLDVPANGTTVRLDLAALPRANASLRDSTVETSVGLSDRGVTVRTAERRGTTITLVLASDARRERIAVRLTVTGIDTRTATPTTGLRYPITATVSAGSTTVESEPFGLYRPGETPSPTPTLVETGTDTKAPSPRTTGDGSGFGATVWAGVVLLYILSARGRHGRK